MTKRILCALLFAGLLGGCTGYRPPPGYATCSTQPGTWACQAEQYERVNF